ncbi:MAG: hypothetical protein M1830_007796 [Pleopsidium flavum]|nr:MAG: hypothetical protein M1830_007796 [Pleopsidium flavum]
MGKGETYWPREVVRISDKNGVEIKGPVGVEDTVKKLREEVEENGSEISDEDDGKDKATSGGGKKSNGGKWTPKDDYEGEERQWFKWDWKLEFAAFYKDHRKQDEYTGKYFLGGGHHDITKFSKADKKRYTY